MVGDRQHGGGAPAESCGVHKQPGALHLHGEHAHLPPGIGTVRAVAVEVVGAEDVADEDDGTTIYTASSDLMKVRAALIEGGLEIDSAELQYVPNNTVPIDEETSAKVEKLMDAIDDLDDVVAVHTNAE